jgi:hypothetical protein
VTRLADGWLASGYNTTPEDFGDALRRLHAALRAIGRDPEHVPNAVASMFLHVTEEPGTADSILTDALAPPWAAHRSSSGSECWWGRRALARNRWPANESAGAERVIVWPVGGGLRRLERFHEGVVARLDAG